MLMRSINTGLVALLPVGGLLFIGAGLTGAGTLKDLGLVLFVGMGAAVYSSIFFATPVLVTLKQREPALNAHTQRVLARRAAGTARRKRADAAAVPVPASASVLAVSTVSAEGPADRGRPTSATSTPRPGARANGAKARTRGGRSDGKRR